MKRYKKRLIRSIPPEIRPLLRRIINSSKYAELRRLQNLPRYQETTTTLEGRIIKIPDAASYLAMQNEIFKEKIYHFNTTNPNPYIIDGGANIGLTSIYFKLLFPESDVIAFEPDPYIFNILRYNLQSFGFKDVDIIQKGLWDENTILNFKPEGADAGLINELTHNISQVDLQKISVISLKSYLKRHVDFLKLDIEGAETKVLVDIQTKLNNVERIFVEYHSFQDRQQSLDKVISILSSAKFRLSITSPSLVSKSPFSKINLYKNMDMQLNIYGYRE